jgi:hypothetical protein
MKFRQEKFHFFSILSAYKNSHYRNVKVINKHFIQKSLAYFYPCRFQQIVSKISPLLCPISLPNRVATSGSRESSHTFRAECGQEAFDLVNWASIGVAMSELKRSWRVFVAKHCSGMCGVGKFYEEMERMG